MAPRHPDFPDFPGPEEILESRRELEKEKTQVVVPNAPRNLSDHRLPPELGGMVGKGKVFNISDPDYRHPVNGLTVAGLEYALNQSIEQVIANFPPHTGVCVFAFDFGKKEDAGGIAYISNADRKGMIKALKEWLARQEKDEK